MSAYVPVCIMLHVPCSGSSFCTCSLLFIHFNSGLVSLVAANMSSAALGLLMVLVSVRCLHPSFIIELRCWVLFPNSINPMIHIADGSRLRRSTSRTCTGVVTTVAGSATRTRGTSAAGGQFMQLSSCVVDEAYAAAQGYTVSSSMLVQSRSCIVFASSQAIHAVYM